MKKFLIKTMLEQMKFAPAEVEVYDNLYFIQAGMEFFIFDKEEELDDWLRNTYRHVRKLIKSNRLN